MFPLIIIKLLIQFLNYLGYNSTKLWLFLLVMLYLVCMHINYHICVYVKHIYKYVSHM